MQDYTGLYRTIWDKKDYTELCRTIQDYTGLHMTIKESIGLYIIIHDYNGICATI